MIFPRWQLILFYVSIIISWQSPVPLNNSWIFYFFCQQEPLPWQRYQCACLSKRTPHPNGASMGILSKKWFASTRCPGLLGIVLWIFLSTLTLALGSQLKTHLCWPLIFITAQLKERCLTTGITQLPVYIERVIFQTEIAHPDKTL